MTNFYDKWLGYWEESEAEREAARLSIDEEDYEWVETIQDHRAALLIAPETGFKTWGGVTMIAEIPPGCHTGKHKHGEESLYILSGAGFSIIDEVRYEWKEGSVVHIPFASPHQHFNTSEVPVRYVSALAVGIEHFVGLHRTVQMAAKGKTTWVPDVPVSADGLRENGKRCVLHKEQARAQVKEGSQEEAAAFLERVKFDPEHPLVLGDVQGMMNLPSALHKKQVYSYMRVNNKENDFEVISTEISLVMIDPPHEYGGKHAHMEAHLFCMGGEGYSEVGDHKVPWKKGTAMHIQGPQTPHRHVNTSDEPMTQLRIAYGVRYFFEKLAKREYPYLFLEPGQSWLKARNVNTSGRT